MLKKEAPLEILVTFPLEEELQDQLKQVSPNINFTFITAKNVDEVPPELLKKANILYTYTVFPDVGQAPNLKWVQFHVAGTDKGINLPLFQENNVIATNISGTNAPVVAEYALMMILALSHNLPKMIKFKNKSEWTNPWETLAPNELRGSTVGIIGYGSIGRQLARLLQPHNVTILAAKRNAMQPKDTGYTIDGMGDPEGEFFTRLYPIEARCSMLKECDFVVIAVPLTTETKGLIGLEELQSMKKGSFLIDVSRGGVVDHEHLLSVLKEEHLAGTALDVFPEEPLPSDNPLWKMPNVIISPHMAGIGPNYNSRSVQLFIENLYRFIEGKPLLNQVDIKKEY